MKRREAEFASKFSRWAKHYWRDDDPAYFEYKVSLTKSLPFNSVSDKQYANLQIHKFYHKFSDFDRMGTPFDAVLFCGTGYVVFQYYEPRNKEFFIMKVQDFIKERDLSGRKSLTEDRARQVAMSYFLA